MTLSTPPATAPPARLEEPTAAAQDGWLLTRVAAGGSQGAGTEARNGVGVSTSGTRSGSHTPSAFRHSSTDPEPHLLSDLSRVKPGSVRKASLLLPRQVYQSQQAPR